MAILKHYYRFIRRGINPALLVKNEKAVQTIPKGIIEEELLLEMYMSILPKSLVQKRDKCMLGIVIFQGIKRSELELLEVEDLDLEQHRILIPAATKTNTRYINLNPTQKRELENYIYQLRDQLLIEARKKTNKLFFSMGAGSSIGNALSRMMRTTKLAYPYFKTLQQIRESRITIWVSKHGIRQTQYLSGIRYASSVLRYKKTDTEKLKQKIAIIHPMEKLVSF